MSTAPKETCRGVVRDGFHILCGHGTRGHESHLCPRHRRAVERGDAEAWKPRKGRGMSAVTLTPGRVNPAGYIEPAGEPEEFAVPAVTLRWDWTQRIKNGLGQEVVPTRQLFGGVVLEFDAAPEWPATWPEFLALTGLGTRDGIDLDRSYAVRVLQRQDQRVRLELAAL